MPRKTRDFVSEYEIDLENLPVENARETVQWQRIYGVDRLFRVEIGVGNSPFLINVSERDPDFNYLGFEYDKQRVCKFLRKVHRAEVTNIRMLRVDAARVLDDLLGDASVDRFYINHPDPWPKKRHAKKRFVKPENAATMLRQLRAGGGISLRTDSPAYADQMLEVLDAVAGLVNLAGTGAFADRPRDAFETPYETRFRAQGLPIYYLEYQKAEA